MAIRAPDVANKLFSQWLLNPSKNPFQFVLNLSVNLLILLCIGRHNLSFSAQPLLWKTCIDSFWISNEILYFAFFAFTANWMYPDKWKFFFDNTLTIHYWHMLSKADRCVKKKQSPSIILLRESLAQHQARTLTQWLEPFFWQRCIILLHFQMH